MHGILIFNQIDLGFYFFILPLNLTNGERNIGRLRSKPSIHKQLWLSALLEIAIVNSCLSWNQ